MQPPHASPRRTPQIDDEVVRLAQRGDERAFAAIVRAHERPVFNYVFRQLGDRELAEDLTQEVFLRVFQSLPRFAFQSQLTTWIFQVAKNRVVDEYRARQRRPPALELRDEHLAPIAHPAFGTDETIQALWRAVETLNLELKTALLLRDVIGFSYDEIAEIVQVPIGTVKWRIHKARDEVQQALGRDGFDRDVRALRRSVRASSGG